METSDLFNESHIIYEDNHILVVKKEQGILSQEDISRAPDILNLVKAYIKKRDNKPGNVYLGLVHRLDRNTAGVMCLAKTSKAASRLSEQIRKRMWRKYYLALSEHAYEINNNEWMIWEDYLEKDQENNKSSVMKTGKKAVTHVKLLPRIPGEARDLSVFLLEIKSGRSHQIRVQMSNRNMPIIGDRKYGDKSKLPLAKNFLGLWAYALIIHHPITQEEMCFTLWPEEEVWAKLKVRDFSTML